MKNPMFLSYLFVYLLSWVGHIYIWGSIFDWQWSLNTLSFVSIIERSWPMGIAWMVITAIGSYAFLRMVVHYKEGITDES